MASGDRSTRCTKHTVSRCLWAGHRGSDTRRSRSRVDIWDGFSGDNAIWGASCSYAATDVSPYARTLFWRRIQRSVIHQAGSDSFRHRPILLRQLWYVTYCRLLWQSSITSLHLDLPTVSPCPAIFAILLGFQLKYIPRHGEESPESRFTGITTSWMYVKMDLGLQFRNKPIGFKRFCRQKCNCSSSENADFVKNFAILYTVLSLYNFVSRQLINQVKVFLISSP